MKLVSSRKDAGALRGFVEMEHPNKLIDNFSGSIEVEGAGAGGAASRYSTVLLIHIVLI